MYFFYSFYDQTQKITYNPLINSTRHLLQSVIGLSLSFNSIFRCAFTLFKIFISCTSPSPQELNTTSSDQIMICANYKYQWTKNCQTTSLTFTLLQELPFFFINSQLADFVQCLPQLMISRITFHFPGNSFGISFCFPECLLQKISIFSQIYEIQNIWNKAHTDTKYQLYSLSRRIWKNLQVSPNLRFFYGCKSCH